MSSQECTCEACCADAGARFIGAVAYNASAGAMLAWVMGHSALALRRVPVPLGACGWRAFTGRRLPLKQFDRQVVLRLTEPVK